MVEKRSSRRHTEARNCPKVGLLHRPDLLHVKPGPKFELIGSDGLFSGLRRLRYGTGQDDPMPFTLTLTPQYVAREVKKAPPVSYLRVQRYAERNADKLKAIAKLERERGLNTHTLE